MSHGPIPNIQYMTMTHGHICKISNPQKMEKTEKYLGPKSIELKKIVYGTFLII